MLRLFLIVEWLLSGVAGLGVGGVGCEVVGPCVVWWCA